MPPQVIILRVPSEPLVGTGQPPPATSLRGRGTLLGLLFFGELNDLSLTATMR